MRKTKWRKKEVSILYEKPFIELLVSATSIHVNYFSLNEIELCTLLSIKTGACPEDCAYCPQSAHYQTHVIPEKMLLIKDILQQAKKAKENGATRFCIGAAWRSPPKKYFEKILEMIPAIKTLGLETCATLGMLTKEQAIQLKKANLDFYNHNLDTSPSYYQKIITTRTFQERLDTLSYVQAAGINICSGGIIGMGESREDRIDLLLSLANLPVQPASVPINCLIAVKGTPLEKAPHIDNLEFIRTVAVARIMMPATIIRLSAGRKNMSEEMQILCFLAGANSIWLGEKLLTVNNCDQHQDQVFLKKLGIKTTLSKHHYAT